MNTRKNGAAGRAGSCSILLLAMVALGGCAGGRLPSPENIPQLEQEVAAAPNSDDATARLGGAYVAARRYEDARRVLTPLVQRSTSNGAAYLYLGLANEELQDFTGARASYEKYLDVGRDNGLKKNIRDRLALVTRSELKQNARAMIQREQVITNEPPTPRTVAVLPFVFSGATEELRPLQTALADMLITDLSVTSSVVPVERVRIQALLDEMLLGQAGLTDAAADTRAGRLLKAEHLVQGAITMTGARQLRVDGTVLATGGADRGTITGQNQVEAIFDLEKQLVESIYQRLGVTLTLAERERINDNRTGNLLAFLAYGRGLEALDRGNYNDASTFFNQATQLDPQFSRAQAQRQEAVQLRSAGEVTTAQIASSATGEAAGIIDVAPPTVGTTDILKQTANEVNFSPGTSMTSQGTQTEGTAQTTQTRQNGSTEAQGGTSGGVQQALKATINIIIPRPGN